MPIWTRRMYHTLSANHTNFQTTNDGDASSYFLSFFFSVLIIHTDHSRLGLVYILISIGIRHKFRNMSCKYDLQLTIVAVGLEPRLHVSPVTLDPVDLGADRVETLLNRTVEALYEEWS